MHYTLNFSLGTVFIKTNNNNVAKQYFVIK